MSVPIKIAGTSGTSADDIANIDVPEDGDIEGISASLYSDDGTLGERASVELSFNSTNQLFSNDARGSLLTISGSAQGGTGVVGYTSNVQMNFPDPIPVSAGERLHLHQLVSAAHTTVMEFIIYFRGKGGGRRATRRR